MCNKPDLLIAFMECGGIIDYRVVPFSDDPNDDVKLEIACRQVNENLVSNENSYFRQQDKVQTNSDKHISEVLRSTKGAFFQG